MKFFVSRQIEWDTGDHVVEISIGNIDCAGPDMLVAKYASYGEGKEFNDPREAVSAAMDVRTWWKSALGDEEVFISFGNSGGMGIQLECYPDDELIKKAEEIYNKLPKCHECGELLPEKEKRYGNESTMMFEDKENQYPFCSEYCAEMNEELRTPDDDDTFYDDALEQ